MTNQNQQEVNQEEIEVVRQIVQRRIGNNYHNLRYDKSGSLGHVFLANHGAPDGELRVLKADRISHNPRAEKYVDRGCGSSRDSYILARLPDARKHHIVRLLHYHPEQDGIAILEMDHIDGETLEERLKNSTLSVDQTKVGIANLLDATNYSSSRGILHRDINPNNIMVERGTDQFFLVDFGCSSEKTCEEDRDLTTYGKRAMADPLLVEKLTGKKRSYLEDSEVHSIAQVGLRCLLGNYAYTIDPDKGHLGFPLNDASILGSDGRIDLKQSQETLEYMLRHLPRDARSLIPALRKALTLDEKERYSQKNAINEFTHDFLKATGFRSVDKPYVSKSGISRRSLLKLAVGLGLATTVAGVYHTSSINELEKQKQEAGKYEVVSEWDENLFIQNNLFSLEPSIRDETFRVSLPEESLVRSRVLKTKQGNKIRVFPYMYEKPFKDNSTGLPQIHGAAYIEGFDKLPFSAWTYSRRAETVYDDGFTGPPFLELTVPDVPDGCYTLAVECYSPRLEDLTKYDRKDFLKNIRFRENGIIARNRVPLIIGNPKNKIGLRKLSLPGYREDIDFQNLTDEKVSTLNFDFSIPSIDYKMRLNNSDSLSSTNFYSGHLKIPRVKTEVHDMFQFSVSDENGLVNFGLVPVKAVKGLYSNTSCDWNYDMPHRDYADRLKAFYQSLRKK